MSIFHDVIAGRLRREMKERTDQIVEITQRLTQELKNNTQAIKQLIGSSDPTVIAEFRISLDRIERSLQSLQQAIEAHRQTLREVIRRLG